MKIINRIVISSTGVVLEEDSFEYNGEVAEAKGSKANEKPQLSPSGKIIGGLAPQLSAALRDRVIDSDSGTNLTNRAIQKAVQNSNAQYGARGLAGSGIAQRGAEMAGSDAALQGADNEAKQLIGVLGAGSGAPSFSPPTPPRGFMGLK